MPPDIVGAQFISGLSPKGRIMGWTNVSITL